MLRQCFADESPAVRIAAARALCRMDKPKQALPVLTQWLLKGAPWEQLQAAIVLDEIDEQAKPVLGKMRLALGPDRCPKQVHRAGHQSRIE